VNHTLVVHRHQCKKQNAHCATTLPSSSPVSAPRCSRKSPPGSPLRPPSQRHRAPRSPSRETTRSTSNVAPPSSSTGTRTSASSSPTLFEGAKRGRQQRVPSRAHLSARGVLDRRRNHVPRVLQTPHRSRSDKSERSLASCTCRTPTSVSPSTSEIATTSRAAPSTASSPPSAPFASPTPGTLARGRQRTGGTATSNISAKVASSRSVRTSSKASAALVTLTNESLQLLEKHQQCADGEAKQAFYSGTQKNREFTHDAHLPRLHICRFTPAQRWRAHPPCRHGHRT